MVRKISSSSLFICALSFLFYVSLFMQASLQNRSYVQVPNIVTQSEAKNFCREYYTDLAAFRSMTEIDTVQTPCPYDTFCWIGLQRVQDGANIWIWSDGEEVNFTQWNEGEPNNMGGKENCVVMKSNEWFDTSCDGEFAFLCFEDVPILVQENKTWEEALEHCRTFHPYSRSNFYDLMHMDYRGFNVAARKVILDAQTPKVWIGLRFLAGHWLWVNGNPLQEQLPVCPEAGKYCGSMSKTGQLVQLSNCAEKMNFICSGN